MNFLVLSNFLQTAPLNLVEKALYKWIIIITIIIIIIIIIIIFRFIVLLTKDLELEFIPAYYCNKRTVHLMHEITLIFDVFQHAYYLLPVLKLQSIQVILTFSFLS